jgi:hypothetical protein
VTSGAAIAVVGAMAAVVVAAMGIIANVIVNTVNRGDDRLGAAIADVDAKVDALAAKVDQIEQKRGRRGIGRRP